MGETTREPDSLPPVVESQPVGGDATAVARDGRGRVLPGTRLGEATRFAPENTEALRHGGRAKRLQARRLAEVQARLVADEAEIVGALGGTVDAMQRVFVTRFVRAVAILEPLEDELLVGTGLTATKRTRRVTPTYQAQLDRVLKAASALGSRQGDSTPLAERLAKAFGKVDQ